MVQTCLLKREAQFTEKTHGRRRREGREQRILTVRLFYCAIMISITEKIGPQVKGIIRRDCIKLPFYLDIKKCS